MTEQKEKRERLFCPYCEKEIMEANFPVPKASTPG